MSNHVVGRRVAVPVVDRAPCIEDDPTARVGEQLHRDGVGLGELHRAQSRVDRVERYCRSVDIARITKRTGVTADAGRRSQVDVIADEVLIPRAFRCRVVGDRSGVVIGRDEDVAAGGDSRQRDAAGCFEFHIAGRRLHKRPVGECDVTNGVPRRTGHAIVGLTSTESDRPRTGHRDRARRHRNVIAREQPHAAIATDRSDVRRNCQISTRTDSLSRQQDRTAVVVDDRLIDRQ